MVMLKTIVLDIHIDFAIVSGSRSYPLKTTALFLALVNPNQAGGGIFAQRCFNTLFKTLLIKINVSNLLVNS